MAEVKRPSPAAAARALVAQLGRQVEELVDRFAIHQLFRDPSFALFAKGGDREERHGNVAFFPVSGAPPTATEIRLGGKTALVYDRRAKVGGQWRESRRPRWWWVVPAGSAVRAVLEFARAADPILRRVYDLAESGRLEALLEELEALKEEGQKLLEEYGKATGQSATVRLLGGRVVLCVEHHPRRGLETCAEGGPRSLEELAELEDWLRELRAELERLAKLLEKAKEEHARALERAEALARRLKGILSEAALVEDPTRGYYDQGWYVDLDLPEKKVRVHAQPGEMARPLRALEDPDLLEAALRLAKEAWKGLDEVGGLSLDSRLKGKVPVVRRFRFAGRRGAWVVDNRRPYLFLEWEGRVVLRVEHYSFDRGTSVQLAPDRLSREALEAARKGLELLLPFVKRMVAEFEALKEAEA